jgi:Uma2 family endonuclease
MSSPGSTVNRELPAVDDRLAVPETRYEVDDGKLVYVPPADPPHSSCQAKTATLLWAHVTDDYIVATEMLTRTSKIDDIAPDVSVYPRAKDPVTGGRRLDELAFEVVSTQTLANARRKLAKLAGRGVRRCFAIDVERTRVLEWSRELGTFSILDASDHIEDPVLAVPLPIAMLIGAAKIDSGMSPALATTLIARGEPIIAAEKARARAEGKVEGKVEGRAEGRVEGKAETLLQLLALRNLQPLAHESARILEERDLERLERWVARALTCSRVAEIFDRE